MSTTAPRHLSTGVLVIGAGGAGMYAAIEAARCGAEVLIVDRSLIGRGGATVMAQMTVAGALGGADIERHIADTLAAGRELCNPSLVELLCRDAAEVIREMDGWGVGWARQGDSLKLVDAPGHEFILNHSESQGMLVTSPLMSEATLLGEHQQPPSASSAPIPVSASPSAPASVSVSAASSTTAHNNAGTLDTTDNTHDRRPSGGSHSNGYLSRTNSGTNYIRR